MMINWNNMKVKRNKESNSIKYKGIKNGEQILYNMEGSSNYKTPFKTLPN